MALALVSSWKFWLGTALAAVSIVLYNEIHGTPSEVGSFQYQTLGRERVLLMNEDRNPNCAIDFQGYAYNGEEYDEDIRAEYEFKGCWIFPVKDTVNLYNLQNNSESELWSCRTDGKMDRREWSLLHCRHGNTHSSDAAIQKVSNYLPHSKTSLSFLDLLEDIYADDSTAGQIVMQNTPDAQVISSCYPDGIGTVYFDAVNAFVGYAKGQIAVDVAYGVWKTNLTGQLIKPLADLKVPDDLERDASGNFIPPDDAHCDEVRHVEDTAAGSVLETTPFKRIAWVRARVTGMKNLNGTHTTLPVNDVVELNVTAGNSKENFYRVWAPVADPAVNPDLADLARGPMRFRLKRVDDPTKVPGTTGISLDGTEYAGKGATYAQRNALLLVDNVIASYPAMKAWAIPGGDYVAGGSARNVIGWMGLTSARFPASGEEGLYASAGLEVATNAPAGVAIGDWMAKTKAAFLWRWRYGNQSISDTWTTNWLGRTDAGLVSEDPLDLPEHVGDIEVRFETVLDAPYYGYLDYSGSTKISGAPGYSERITGVTSRLNPDARGRAGRIPDPLPSGGDDFFFRLREGKSDQLEYRLEVRVPGETKALMGVPCWLTADRAWKTYLKTTTNELKRTEIRSSLPRGTYEVRLAAVDPAGTFVPEPIDRIPLTGGHLSRSEGGAWAKLTVDAATDALMFQFTEDPVSADALAFTVVHASFQDFNGWSDAKTEAGLYTGAFFEGRGKQSGSSPDTREYPNEIPSWSATASDRAMYWTEAFLTDRDKTPLDGYAGHKAYEPFASSRTPNGWEAIASMWVCSKWRESAKNGEMALQLGGDNDGLLRYSRTAEVPHGIDCVTYRARIAQAASFDGFAYYLGAALSSQKNYLFTARAAMSTTVASTEFDGNGSVSLVGYYQPGRGCYELRAERIASNTVRIYLYKWLRDRTGYTCKLVGYDNSTLNFTTQTYLRCSNAGDTSALQKDAYYGELFMCCQTVDGTTAKITAGVMNASKKLEASGSGSAHYYFIYTDDGKNEDLGPALTYGTFGFGSLNCPAQLIRPQFYANGDGGTYPTDKNAANPRDEAGNEIKDDKRKCYNGNSPTYPSGGKDLLDSAADYENWAIPYGRYEAANFSTYRGLKTLDALGELELWVTAGGKDSFVTNRVLTGFRYETVTNAVRNTLDSQMKLTTAVWSDDIVVDDVAFGQWASGTYTDPDCQDFADKVPTLGCPTNFVYVNAWVVSNGDERTVGLLPMRARQTRTPGDQPVAVRAPLMDGLDGRGIGLGSIAYAYRDADAHCRILVQYRDDMESVTYLRDRTAEVDGWKTVATNDFASGDYDLKEGVISVYVGAHAAKGVMRIVVDPQVVKDSQDRSKNAAGDPNYGAITLTRVTAKDEPPLYGLFWWGWNIRTTDDQDEIGFYDADGGLAMALNNSVTEDTEPWDGDETDEQRRARFSQHVPFVESPTFFTNLINEVSFRARKMSPTDGPTEVTILGARDAEVSQDTEWRPLQTVVVDSIAFETYAYKAKANDGYRSFRLAVVGVEGVGTNYRDAKLPDGTPAMKIPAAQRVLIDEVSVSEGVYGQVSFKDVGAFRDPLNAHEYVTNLLEVVQQPMCEESWSVQCEIYASQLEEEVLLDDDTEVTLHWYRGDKWGYSNWADDPAAKSAKLARIRDRPGFVFRGSYAEASEAIVEPIYDSGAVVQYMLVAKYKNADGSWADPHLLTSGEWTKPAWYRGVDYNRQNGGFAAYTILDTVAYGYAWINEVNVYDGPDPDSDISGTNQFVEIAMPEQANISGWRLEFVTGGLDENPYARLYTNVVATFTDDSRLWSAGLVPSTKDVEYMDEDSTYVFLAVGNAASANPGMMADHRIDGAWKVRDEDQVGEQVNRSTGTIDCGMPIGIRLVRPSGIVEHEIVVAGTNRYDFYGPPYSWTYSATNYLARMNRFDPDRSWTGPRADAAFPQDYGISVTSGASVATDASVWAHWRKTPGRVNECNGVKELIDPDYPRPQGSMVRLYAQLQGGYIDQTVGEFVATVSNVVLWVRKDSPGGTNIVYHITNGWYELASLVETSKDWTREHPDKVGSRGRFGVPVAVHASNDVKVVAKTRVRADIDALLGPDNDYREAVLKWLEAGKWGPRSNRRDFADQGGEVHPAAYHSVCGKYVRDLRLTEMYWLDIDPTAEGTVYQAGMCDPPVPVPVEEGREDVVLGVMMKIYNTNGLFEAYAPYTLNGIRPGQTSMDHPASWDSVTFKITGNLRNGMDPTKDPDKVWMPLRYFVFDEGSFDGFKAKIQVMDPFVQFAEWRKYVGCDVWYCFGLDTRKFGAVADEVLKPDSTFGE